MSRCVRCFLALFLLVNAIASAEGPVRPMNVGDPAADLLYTPLTPCRIVDTRIGGGSIASGQTRGYIVAGTTGFSLQGGNSGGCGIPEDAAAAQINFVAVNPQGAGNLRGSAYPVPIPTTGSIINYQSLTPGLNVANALAFPICNSSTTLCDVDITILVNGAATDVVADVLGFFRKFPDGGITTTQLADDAVTPEKIDTTGASPGQVLTFSGSQVQWQLPPQGTITQVSPGVGLSGGGTGGNVSLDVAFGGTGSATSVARSDHRHYARTILVSPVGADTANGAALISAVQAIAGASFDNPYLVKIEPGVYNLGTVDLEMRSFVDIEGSGENVTRITGAGGFPGDGVITGADDAELRLVTVESTGGSQPAALAIWGSNVSLRDVTLKASNGVFWAQPIYLNSGSMNLKNVNIIATNGGSSGNIGIYMNGVGSATLQDVTITTSGPNSSYGLWVNGTADARRVTLNLSNTGTGSVYGILTSTGDVLNLADSTINASSSGGGTVYGVYLETGTLTNTTVNASSSGTATVTGLALVSSGDIESSRIVATNSGTGVVYGIRNFGGALRLANSLVSGKTGVASTGVAGGSVPVVVEHSRIVATFSTFISGAGMVLRIGASRLEGGAISGAATCAGVYDENFLFFPSTCP